MGKSGKRREKIRKRSGNAPTSKSYIWYRQKEKTTKFNVLASKFDGQIWQG